MQYLYIYTNALGATIVFYEKATVNFYILATTSSFTAI